MPKLSDVIQPKGLKLLQYGESGAGKSVRACKFAQFGPLYVFDFDNKMDNVKPYLDKNFPELSTLIEYDVYRGEDAHIVERVFAKLNEFQAKPAYATIVFDSWTAWENAFIAHLISKFMGYGGKNWGEQRQTVQITKDVKVTLPGTADHQLKNRAIAEFIDKITSLPCNLIVNCHLNEPAEGPATIQASGAIAKTLPKYFNEWHRLYVAPGAVYRVQARGNDKFLANTSRVDVPLSGLLDKDDLAVYASQLVRMERPKS